MNYFLGLGNDIIEISRIEKAIKNLKFIQKIYTEEEIELIVSKGNKAETYAGRFSAKESISKALGTGMRKISFSDIEIINNKLGKPIVRFKNSIEDYNEKYLVEISISHCREYAISTAIIFKKGKEVID
ncbi:holo-ACP synthase [Fusobacterium sp. IOR10]|uniref:holo-ACP synthase n=1 Tax=Fusobacterium sp. IOR10 TaxID=2665157 RepID=UPI0013D26C4B|nr:holo-ACP synthase [Fusobacterium sp. IOR10]